jgi:predicted small metal-binding protein
MSGGGGRFGCDGRGHAGGQGKGRGHGQNYAGTSTANKKGLCEALGSNVFDCGQKAAADQMQTSLEKVIEHVGTTHGQDIANELQNKVTVVIVEPVHTPALLLRNWTCKTIIRAGHLNTQNA